MTFFAAVMLMLAIASPVVAARPRIAVVDGVEEGTWASQSIDVIFGESITVTYSGSDWARFTCPGWSEITYLPGEGGPRAITPIIGYVAGTYTVCSAELLGKRGRVIARDTFTIYSPV